MSDEIEAKARDVLTLLGRYTRECRKGLVGCEEAAFETCKCKLIFNRSELNVVGDALRAYGDQREREALEKAAEIAHFWADPSVPERIEALIPKAAP